MKKGRRVREERIKRERERGEVETKTEKTKKKVAGERRRGFER